jgi:hypothetical protein
MLVRIARSDGVDAGSLGAAPERSIEGDDVAGECDAGSPGSDGASSYPKASRAPRVKMLIIPLLSVQERHHLGRVTFPFDSNLLEASIGFFQIALGQPDRQSSHIVFQIAHSLRAGDWDHVVPLG